MKIKIVNSLGTSARYVTSAHHYPHGLGNVNKTIMLSKFKTRLTGNLYNYSQVIIGERGGSVVECRTPEREVGGSKPTAAVLCP